jgi:hypothetical protein
LKASRQMACESLDKVCATQQEACKVIEQTEFDQSAFTTTIKNLDDEIKDLMEQEESFKDNIELLKDITKVAGSDGLFFFANKTRTEIQRILGLETEADLNKVEPSDFELILKGLQEAGMEYHTDVIAKKITIETSHSHGVDSYKKQVAKVLGIELMSR